MKTVESFGCEEKDTRCYWQVHFQSLRKKPCSSQVGAKCKTGFTTTIQFQCWSVWQEGFSSVLDDCGNSFLRLLNFKKLEVMCSYTHINQILWCRGSYGGWHQCPYKHNLTCKVLRWSFLTWSPRLRPTSAALLPDSTASMKTRKPFSWPPSRLKARGESLDGLVSVTSRGLALAAHAIFNSLRCPHIFWEKEKNNTQMWEKWHKLTESNFQWICNTYFFLQIAFKLLQKVSHGRVTLKVIEVIVYPQQDYPCNLEQSHVRHRSTHSLLVD